MKGNDKPRVCPELAETAACERPKKCPGVACRKCGCCHLPVYHVRRQKGCIVRVRECRNGGRRLVTREAEM